jgi:hypothetical protein
MGTKLNHPSFNNKKSKSPDQRGIQKYSWTVYDMHADKRTDKSVFITNETCLPRELVRDFFSVKDIVTGDGRIILHYDSKQFIATIGMSQYGSYNTDLIWRKDFAQVLHLKFPQWFEYFKNIGKKTNKSPMIRFRKRSSFKEYDVELIEPTGLEKIPDHVSILEKYQEYDRKSIHDIFDPDSPFTPQGGTWGLRGIIEHPPHSGNFIFFVTLNRPDLGMTIEEGITESGILIWQSEPQQNLASNTIKKFLSHDDRKNSILLFLRANRYRDYCYFGRLKYIWHKPKKEEPVQITWQILDWDFSKQQAEQIELQLLADEDPVIEKVFGKKIFIKEDPPENRIDESVNDSQGEARGAGKSDYADKSQKNTEIGLQGELAIIEMEKANLRDAEVPILIEKIDHVSLRDDSLGYDIRSVTPSGETKFIEVKTTTMGKNQPFILTRAEIRRYKKSAQCYCLYRLFNFKEGTNVIRYYTLEGDLTNKISREPLQFSCKPLGKEMKETLYLQDQ